MFLSLLFHTYPLHADLSRLGAVVRLGHLLQPRMLQGLLCSNTMGRVVDEYFL